MPRYGTLQILDTLATYNNTTVLQFGEEVLAGYMNMIIDAYEAFLAEIQGELAGVVPDRISSYGTNSTTMDMVDLDEYALADAQKVPFAASQVGWPLRRVGATLQWTRDYLATTTPAELANQVVAMTEADERRWYRDIRRALLNASNNTGYIDRMVDNANFAIRALVNADSQPIPPHPQTLTTFNAATHTHYLGTASFVASDLTALIETVREHFVLPGNTIRVYINAAQEAAVRAFSGFYPYTDARLIYADNATRAAQSTDQIYTEDRAIGFFGVAEVWVKPWMPANYVLAFQYGPNGDPVLGIRRPDGAYAPWGSLRIVSDLDRHPLHARAYERYRGVAAWNRTRAAVLYTANATYSSYTGN